MTDLEAAREELDTLQTIFGAMKNGTIRAIEWPEAKRTLDYLDAKILEAQGRYDALAPAVAEVTNG